MQPAGDVKRCGLQTFVEARGGLIGERMGGGKQDIELLAELDLQSATSFGCRGTWGVHVHSPISLRHGSG